MKPGLEELKSKQAAIDAQLLNLEHSRLDLTRQRRGISEQMLAAHRNRAAQAIPYKVKDQLMRERARHLTTRAKLVTTRAVVVDPLRRAGMNLKEIAKLLEISVQTMRIVHDGWKQKQARTLKLSILEELREVTGNPALALNHMLEWRKEDIEAQEGDILAHLPRHGLNVAYRLPS